MRKKTMRLILCMLLCLTGAIAFAQEKRTVSGVVKDSTGGPLAGASISAKGSKVLGLSDDMIAKEPQLLPKSDEMPPDGPTHRMRLKTKAGTTTHSIYKRARELSTQKIR